jgi:hypothetical protein
VLVLTSPDVVMAFKVLVYFVVSVGFGMACEWFWRGRTPGKRVMRLRVVDLEGLRLSFSQVAIRNLTRVVDLLPGLYGVGAAAMLMSSRAQRLGDIAANTLVIHQPKVTDPDVSRVLAGRFNSLRRHPHLEARLRQQVPPAEAALALRALMRRDQLEDRERVKVFGEIADVWRRRVPFPEEDVAGLTDEQYVRSCVDSLFRTAKPAGQGGETTKRND